jgi:hypothetical protein
MIEGWRRLVNGKAHTKKARWSFNSISRAVLDNSGDFLLSGPYKKLGNIPSEQPHAAKFATASASSTMSGR